MSQKESFKHVKELLTLQHKEELADDSLSERDKRMKQKEFRRELKHLKKETTTLDKSICQATKDEETVKKEMYAVYTNLSNMRKHTLPKKVYFVSNESYEDDGISTVSDFTVNTTVAYDKLKQYGSLINKGATLENVDEMIAYDSELAQLANKPSEQPITSGQQPKELTIMGNPSSLPSEFMMIQNTIEEISMNSDVLSKQDATMQTKDNDIISSANGPVNYSPFATIADRIEQTEENNMNASNFEMDLSSQNPLEMNDDNIEINLSSQNAFDSKFIDAIEQIDSVLGHDFDSVADNISMIMSLCGENNPRPDKKVDINTLMPLRNRSIPSLDKSFDQDDSSKKSFHMGDDVHYKSLRLDPRNTCIEKLKLCYRRLVLEFHPDKNPDATPEEKRFLEEKFCSIRESYEHIQKNAKKTNHLPFKSF